MVNQAVKRKILKSRCWQLESKLVLLLLCLTLCALPIQTRSAIMEGHSDNVQVILSPEEFAQDAECLGRANGNIKHRKPGLDGIHDGQVMVRLKKKRFIIIDYSIIPTEADIQAAALNPNIVIPEGAGIQQCISPDCSKVGVPILLYDSEPEANNQSLYMKTGLCFTCQRNLNEKRRTSRKRKSDILAEQQITAMLAAQQQQQQLPPLYYQNMPSDMHSKKFKVGGSNAMDLPSEELIIKNAVEDVARQCTSQPCGYPAIGIDLQDSLLEAAASTQHLVAAVTSNSGPDPVATAFTSAVAAARGNHSDTATTADDITALYEKAFISMSKGMILLSQWKASWDAAVAATVAQEALNGDTSLVDAVASAAAVAAASDVPSILAPPESAKEAEKTEKDKEVFSV